MKPSCPRERQSARDLNKKNDKQNRRQMHGAQSRWRKWRQAVSATEAVDSG